MSFISCILAGMKEWIDIKERKPEVKQMVLCARKQTSMSGVVYINPSVGCLWSSHGKFSCEFDWINVTHWMVLPENPKEDESKTS